MPIWLLIYLLCGSIYMAVLHMTGYMISKRKDFIPRDEPSKPLLIIFIANIIGIILFPIVIITFTYGMLDYEQRQRHLLKQLVKLRDLVLRKEKESEEAH